MPGQRDFCSQVEFAEVFVEDADGTFTAPLPVIRTRLPSVQGRGIRRRRTRCRWRSGSSGCAPVAFP